MKFLNRWHSLLFMLVNPAFASVLSLPEDLFDKAPINKKLHNAITGSVQNDSVSKNIRVDDQRDKDNLFAQVSSSAPVSSPKIENNDIDTAQVSQAARISEKETSYTQDDLVKDNVQDIKQSSHIINQDSVNDDLDGQQVAAQGDDKDKSDSSTSVEQQEEKQEKNVLYQEPGFVDNQESVVFNFEETDLLNVALYLESIHKVKFITEDILIPAPKGAQGLSGHKITFRTNKVLTKKESWDLFITFLHIAGLDLVPMVQAGFYKIVAFSKAKSEPIPTFIGTDAKVLPDNDMVIRYVYFMRNIDPAKIQKILLPMQGGSGKLEVFSEMKALIFLDRANNIKSLMQIVLEMDRSVLPESLSVIKLKRANAADVKTLYESLNKPAAGQPKKAWIAGKRESSFEYFPQDVDIFTDARTNSLILLGSDKGIKKIEDFVDKYIDAEVIRDAPPVFTYPLEYTNATDIVAILKQAISYGAGTPAGQYGGVRDGIKYFSQMTLVAEPHSNSIIINSTKEDYEALVPLIKELDIPQKQIGLEVLIVQVSDSEAKVLGAQISGPNGPDAPPGSSSVQQAQTFATNIAAQTSGILGTGGQATAPVVTKTTLNPNATNPVSSYSLKSSLGALLGSAYNGAVNEAGAILVTFGQPIWALFKVLQSMVSVHVVANPFVVVSNNCAAQVSIGEMRRILSSQVVSAFGTTTSGLTNANSTLGFNITPQINKGNIINLQITVTNNQFIVAGSATSATQDQKQIMTNASVANGEVLVLGGLMQESYSSTSRGVPFLEHIPILGWFFKSKVKSIVKSHFLVFISPRLIETPHKKQGGVDSYTLYKMNEAQKNIDIMEEIDWFASKRDPLQKAFFGESMPKSLKMLTGQEATIDAKRKDIAHKKNKRYELAQSEKAQRYKKNKKVNDILTDKQARIRSKSKKPSKETVKPISFDDDFVHMPSKNSVNIGKNSISNSMQLGGNYVS